MLQGKPLNNFVTLKGTVRIMVDGVMHSTHEGNLMEWRHKDRLSMIIDQHLSEIQNSFESYPIKPEEVILMLKARDEGITKNHAPFLHLFYYQYERPTDKEVREQIFKLRQMVFEEII